MEIRRHEYDTRLAREEIKQRQLIIQKKKDKFSVEKTKCIERREKTQLFLDEEERRHARAQNTQDVLPASVNMEDIERAVTELKIPRHMKRKLLETLYSSAHTEDE